MKELNIGAMKLSIPDYSSDVGQVVEKLQNEYESGNIRAMFVVYSTTERVNYAAVGDAMVLPFMSMCSRLIAERELDDIEDSLLGRPEFGGEE